MSAAPHLSSCHQSRAWRGERACYSIYPKEQSDCQRIAQILREATKNRDGDVRELPFIRGQVLYWAVNLEASEAEWLKRMTELKDSVCLLCCLSEKICKLRTPYVLLTFRRFGQIGTPSVPAPARMICPEVRRDVVGY